MAYIQPVITDEDRNTNSDYAMTLEEIGQIEGVSREYIRQIQNKAIAKLKRNYPGTLWEMRDMANYLRDQRETKHYRSVIQ